MSNKADKQAKTKGEKATKRKRKTEAEIRQYGRYGNPHPRRMAGTRPSQEQPGAFEEMAAMMGMMSMVPLLAHKR